MIYISSGCRFEGCSEGFCPSQAELCICLGGRLIGRSHSCCRYAGAGLFDSLQFPAPKMEPYDFSEDLLLLDTEFQKSVLLKIAAASLAVVGAMGGVPQDIEGALLTHPGQEAKLIVLQTRPQV
jgi:hypothetical protein